MWAQVVERAKLEIAVHLSQPLDVALPPSMLEHVLRVADGECLRNVVVERCTARVCGYFSCGNRLRSGDGDNETFCSVECAARQRDVFARCRSYPPDSRSVFESVCALFPKLERDTVLLAQAAEGKATVVEKAAPTAPEALHKPRATDDWLQASMGSLVVPQPCVRPRLNPASESLGIIWGLCCPEVASFVSVRLHNLDVSDCTWLSGALEGGRGDEIPAPRSDAAVEPALRDQRRDVFVSHVEMEIPSVTKLARIEAGSRLRGWVADIADAAPFELAVEFSCRETKIVVAIVLFLLLALCDDAVLAEYRRAEKSITQVLETLRVKHSTVSLMLASLING